MIKLMIIFLILQQYVHIDYIFMIIYFKKMLISLALQITVSSLTQKLNVDQTLYAFVRQGKACEFFTYILHFFIFTNRDFFFLNTLNCTHNFSIKRLKWNLPKINYYSNVKINSLSYVSNKRNFIFKKCQI